MARTVASLRFHVALLEGRLTLWRHFSLSDALRFPAFTTLCNDSVALSPWTLMIKSHHRQFSIETAIDLLSFRSSHIHRIKTLIFRLLSILILSMSLLVRATLLLQESFKCGRQLFTTDTEQRRIVLVGLEFREFDD